MSEQSSPSPEQSQDPATMTGEQLLAWIGGNEDPTTAGYSAVRAQKALSVLSARMYNAEINDDIATVQPLSIYYERIQRTYNNYILHAYRLYGTPGRRPILYED